MYNSDFKMRLYVNLKFHWGIYSLRFLGSRENVEYWNADSSTQIPYIKELERAVLRIIRKNQNDKERLKEILEDYASRYAKEYNIGT